jgi:PAS domain S-box-containing protein
MGDECTAEGLTIEKAEAALRSLMPALAPAGPEARRPVLALVEKPDKTDLPARPREPNPRERPERPPWSEQTLRSLLETAPDAVVVVNECGNIVLINAQTETMFGYHREELLGQAVEILVPERFRGRHLEHRKAYAASRRTRPMGAGLELFGRRKDGLEFPVEISLSPLETPEGVLVTSTVRDISERRRGEALLRKAEARYRTLVEELPAVTFVAALDEGVNELYVSPQIEALLGFSQKEWLEDPVLWFKQLHPDDRERWHIEFARTCAMGQPFRSVYRFLTRDGRVVWVHGEAKVFRDNDGRPLFLQGVAFDITGMKQAEEDLRALNQTLEQRVAERTAVAEQRALELERSNDALEDFAGVTAHELKEPLRAMKSFAQLLARRYAGKLDLQADEFIGRVVNAGNRMEGLISALLDYARVGRQGQPAPVNGVTVFAAACELLQAPLEDSSANVIPEALEFLQVLGVETELVLLFKNLIGNALKFRGERPVEVRVGAERLGGEWRCRVCDNGIGIAPEHVGRLFRMGERLHSRTQYPGHGIGLATCKKIVERHGGRIWIESEPDKGSTFYFTLAAAPAVAM